LVKEDVHSSFAARSSDCSGVLSYICEWRGVTCPTNYDQLGHLSDGGSCFSVPNAPGPQSGEMCAMADVDEQRSLITPSSAFAAEQITRLMGNHDAWLSARMDMNGSWFDANGAELDVLQDIVDLTRKDWISAQEIEGNVTACVRTHSNGAFEIAYNESCDNDDKRPVCQYDGEGKNLFRLIIKLKI